MTSDGIRAYTWNARNQLTAIGSTTFLYDGVGRRAQNGAGVSFVYDGLNPVQEIVGGSARANLLTGGLDEYFARTDAGGTSSFLTDALGSTLALADSTGAVQTQYTYEPFGGTTSSGASSTNAFQYTGHENDGSGMYYYRARYYNASLGRFISEDPIGFLGGQANLYAYVGDDPIDFLDPFGLRRYDRAKCAADFGTNHSIAAAFGAQNNFVANLFGGNSVSGLVNLGLFISGDSTPTTSQLAGVALKGAAQGIPVPPGNPGLSGAVGQVRGLAVQGAVSAAYNAITGVGAEPIELGITAAGTIATPAVQLGAETLSNIAFGVGIAKFAFDASTVLYGYFVACRN
jgi:RHS repeat-associated protein